MNFTFNLYLSCVCVCVCVSVCVNMPLWLNTHVQQHVCGGQNITFCLIRDRTPCCSLLKMPEQQVQKLWELFCLGYSAHSGSATITNNRPCQVLHGFRAPELRTSCMPHTWQTFDNYIVFSALPRESPSVSFISF